MKCNPNNVENSKNRQLPRLVIRQIQNRLGVLWIIALEIKCFHHHVDANLNRKEVFLMDRHITGLE